LIKLKNLVVRVLLLVFSAILLFMLAPNIISWFQSFL
jgi:hypothetical protein